MKALVTTLVTTGALLVALAPLSASASDHEGEKADDPKVCKMVKVPGNRTKTRVCQKQSFWDEQMEIERAAAAGEKVDYRQRQRED